VGIARFRVRRARTASQAGGVAVARNPLRTNSAPPMAPIMTTTKSARKSVFKIFMLLQLPLRNGARISPRRCQTGAVGTAAHFITEGNSKIGSWFLIQLPRLPARRLPEKRSALRTHYQGGKIERLRRTRGKMEPMSPRSRTLSGRNRTFFVSRRSRNDTMCQF